MSYECNDYIECECPTCQHCIKEKLKAYRSKDGRYGQRCYACVYYNGEACCYLPTTKQKKFDDFCSKFSDGDDEKGTLSFSSSNRPQNELTLIYKQVAEREDLKCYDKDTMVCPRNTHSTSQFNIIKNEHAEKPLLKNFDELFNNNNNDEMPLHDISLNDMREYDNPNNYQFGESKPTEEIENEHAEKPLLKNFDELFNYDDKETSDSVRTILSHSQKERETENKTTNLYTNFQEDIFKSGEKVPTKVRKVIYIPFEDLFN